MDKEMEDVDKRVEWLHSEQYSAAGNVFGEPQKLTRIGDEYQAQIPSLMTENEWLDDDQSHFELGLSFHVTWVHYQHKNKEETIRSGMVGCGKDDIFLPLPCLSKEESWSVTEHDSFLLGLYIFGKNLGVVRKFVGNKGMLDVLSYYYGKFYRSDQHKKWLTYRKKRSRMSMPGKRIFSGWRRHELLSRILPNVTDECKRSLTQVVKTYEEGKVSPEKYVFTLRDTVGINLLIESIAIGKGKQDLTNKKPKGMLKNKQIQSTRASLKTEEIVNSLKDRIGLSKARLNDLFWEVVWPRLLARGWHSEQPKNYAVQNPKDSLVFLAPGVTKFSRRSLEKGSQYFDSFTEVLNKVASEPHLLEHQPDPDDEQGPDDEQDSMSYTIVDTSLVGVVEVKEVTSLPGFEPADTQASTSVSRTKRQRVKNTSDEDEAMENALSEKKGTRMVIDLNIPRVGPDSDGDNNSPSSIKQSVVTDSTANQAELLNAGGTNGQRQSRRNRALTPKALESLANEFLNPKKRRGGPEDGTRRRVRGKTALVSSCSARYMNNLGDGAFNGSSHVWSVSPQ